MRRIASISHLGPLLPAACIRGFYRGPGFRERSRAAAERKPPVKDESKPVAPPKVEAKAKQTPPDRSRGNDPRRQADAQGESGIASDIVALGQKAYRSAFCREQIRERSKTAAIELALKDFEEFTHGLATFRNMVAERDAVRAADGELAQLQKLIDLFEEWYFQRCAPRVVDIARPSEWYPRARMMRRKFVFHCGPTNSGKTHAALEALASANSGVYCAPLKALAAQVWRQLNRRVPCDLLIGDQREFAGFADHTSCTVEMTPIDFTVDVGVIDEIQMIEDRDRGWAWTRALLGLPAREIHLCGEERALAVVKKLLYEAKELRGLEVRRYNRLVPLELQEHSLDGDFQRLENGDCLVTFSRKSVFSLAAAVRRARPDAHVRTIYGSLPFIVRERESDAFNACADDASGGKSAILVTTDAIAYGLNLSIRRVLFTATSKFNGREHAPLPPSTVMQVGGRAGRFGKQFERGFVAGLRSREHDDLMRVIGQPGEIGALQATTPINQAGLLPTAEVLGTYVAMHRRREEGRTAGFDDLVRRFATECRVSGVYFACDMERALMPIARLVAQVDMADDDRVLFCFAPVATSDAAARETVAAYAKMHAAGGPVRLLLDERLERVTNGTFVPPAGAQRPSDRGRRASTSSADAELIELETIYRLAEAYCWLAWRFRRTFGDLQLGTDVKAKAAEEIAKRLPH